MRLGPSLSLGLPAAFLLFITVLSAWTVALLWSEREAIRAEAERNALNLAGALGAHSALAVGDADRTLRSLIRNVDPAGVAEDPALRRTLDSRLAELQRETPQILALHWLGRDGSLLASSAAVTGQEQDRAAAIPAGSRRGRLAGALQIAPAVEDAAAQGRPAVEIRRELLVDGEPAAVVVALLSLDGVRALFSATDLGRDGSLTLFRDDGVLIARSPQQATLVGEDFSEGPLFTEQLPNGDSGTFAWRDPRQEGRLRLEAFWRAPGLPLVALAGQSGEEVFAAWRRRAYASGSALLLLFLVTAVFGARGIASEARQLREARAHSRQLAKLAEAGTRLARASDVEELFALVAELAREVVPSHQAVVSVTRGPDFGQAIHSVSLGERYAAYRSYQEEPDGSGIYRLVCETNQPLRLTQAELEAHPAWKGFGAAAPRHPPMRGWLAVPLIGEGDRNLGLVQLSDREEGDFSADDEALMTQLASLISVAVENLGSAEAQRAAQQAAETAVAERERILASITDGFFVLDSQWRCLYCNEQAKRILQRDDLIGESLWEVVPGALETPMWPEFHRARDQGEAVAFEMFSAPLQRWFEVRAFPFEGRLTVFLQDVSARRETEARLRQAQKMEAVGQLTGGVAHDFNNLLTVVLGNCELLVEEGEGHPELQRAANLVMMAGQRGAELTRRLLAFARRQPLSPRPVEVGALLEEIAPLLHSTIGEQIDLRLRADTGDWRAFVDAAELQSAIVNLAINARDAMPDGGRLTLEAGRATFEEAAEDGGGRIAAGSYLVVAVSDTGTGMTEEVRRRAFEPFFTTKPPSRGSGLGLSMVYGFVTQSQGRVSIYSEPGEGTTVKLYLPRWTDQAVAEETTAEPSGPAPRGRAGILLVEDDAMVRDFVSGALTEAGYRVIVAGDGPQALAEIEAGATFDLLLTDVILPGGLNGRQLADRVLARRPQTRVLFMSGYTENAIVHHGRLDPGVELLQKPFRRNELLRRLYDLLPQGPGQGSDQR